jgi:RimJ/RimL family protein N-acetyltransferase
MRAAPPEIRTARLLLRAWREQDLAPFAALNSDPRVMEHFPALLSRAESDALAASFHAHAERHGFAPWALEAPGHAAFIGCVGLARPAFVTRFTPCVEVLWRIAREHWGHGFATEAAAGALRFAFEQLALDEIVSFAVPANRRSLRVMEKLGMAQDPEGSFEHPLLPAGHPLRLHVLYRIRRSDWIALPERAT